MSGLGFSHEPKIVAKVSTAYRTIATAIPVPESIPILNRLYETESHSMHGQLPIIWDRAEGFQVFDAWGNKWLDFSSTTNWGRWIYRLTCGGSSCYLKSWGTDEWGYLQSPEQRA